MVTLRAEKWKSCPWLIILCCVVSTCDLSTSFTNERICSPNQPEWNEWKRIMQVWIFRVLYPLSRSRVNNLQTKQPVHVTSCAMDIILCQLPDAMNQTSISTPLEQACFVTGQRDQTNRRINGELLTETWEAETCGMNLCRLQSSFTKICRKLAYWQRHHSTN